MDSGDGLERFVDAQAAIYDDALAELHRGLKQGHWMWFVFPQIAGLGHSAMSRRYAIRSREEGCRYLAHPLLGPRLRACVDAVLDHAGAPPATIFGDVDALKFQSSMTLFDAVGGASDRRFADALGAFHGGERDPATLRLLA